MPSSMDELSERYASFVADRDWEQFHTPKNLAEALAIEASELMECFLWHDNLLADEIREDPELMDDIREELADVVIYAIGMANRLDIDLLEAVEQKMSDNEQRFDTETAKSANARLAKFKRD